MIRRLFLVRSRHQYMFDTRVIGEKCTVSRWHVIRCQLTLLTCDARVKMITRRVLAQVGNITNPSLKNIVIKAKMFLRLIRSEWKIVKEFIWYTINPLVIIKFYTTIKASKTTVYK